MQFGKEKIVKCHDFEMKMSKNEETSLLKYAKKNILEDKQYLLNWAVNKGLENYIKSLETGNTTIKKLIKKRSKVV